MPVSISSTRELEIWIDQNDDAVATLLAARATFRVLPNLVWTLEKEKPEVPAPLAMLWTLRCLISAISAILSGDAELIEATKRAAAFTQSLGHSTAISNAYYTARSVEPGRGGKLLAIGVLDNPQFAKPERWREIELDAKSIDERSQLDSLMRVPIWRTAPPSDLAPDQRFFEKLKQILGTPASEFWNQWLVEIYEGRAKNWELYREVCLIDDAIWRTGPEAVAEEILRIELAQQIIGRSFDQNSSRIPKSSTLKSSINVNRDAIAVSAVSLIEQVENFRERVRGLNTLEPSFREEVIEFSDYLTSSLSVLISALPTTEGELSEDNVGRVSLWFRSYKDVLLTKLAHYSSPENVAEATIPTSIVLGFTAIGAMLGQPLAGAAVGGLITNQMKPAQAAKELLKRTEIEETDGT